MMQAQAATTPCIRKHSHGAVPQAAAHTCSGVHCRLNVIANMHCNFSHCAKQSTPTTEACALLAKLVTKQAGMIYPMSVRAVWHVQASSCVASVCKLRATPMLVSFNKHTWLTSPAAGLAHVRASGADWNLVSQIATVPPDAPVAASVGRDGCTSRQCNCSHQHAA